MMIVMTEKVGPPQESKKRKKNETVERSSIEQLKKNDKNEKIRVFNDDSHHAGQWRQCQD